MAVKRGRPQDDGTFWYIDAVEEAVCFGWIDSTTKRIADGLMTDVGRAVLPDMSAGGFVIDTDIMEALKADLIVWENFMHFPELYRRIRIDTIRIKQKQPALFYSRLQKFIEKTREASCMANGMIMGGCYNQSPVFW